jgi:hypothetical protein
LEAAVAFEASPWLYGTFLACQSIGLTVVLSWCVSRNAMVLTGRDGEDPLRPQVMICSAQLVALRAQL